MIGKMMVKKILRNSPLRKQEKLGYRLGPLIVLTRGAMERALIDVIGLGCLLIRVYNKFECKG